VKDESALHRARDRLESFGIRFKTFTEPDLGNQMTALATEAIHGDLRRVFRKYQLLKGETHNDLSTKMV
jgi:hypothetical protein